MTTDEDLDKLDLNCALLRLEADAVLHETKEQTYTYAYFGVNIDKITDPRHLRAMVRQSQDRAADKEDHEIVLLRLTREQDKPRGFVDALVRSLKGM